MRTKNYQSRFAEAAVRTREHGLKVPSVRYDPRRLLTTKFQEQFPDLLKQALGNISLEDLVYQRLGLHYGLGPNVSMMLNSEVYLTLGWVQLQDEDGQETRLFEFDDEWIEKSLERGNLGRRSTELHAWLTLPSMEIIDLSLISSVALINHKPSNMGSVLIHYADELQRGVCYVPMLIGEDFLRRTGMLSEFLTLH